jgi:hypothetical protein
MTLLYSPEVPTSFQPRKEVIDTSPFNKHRDDPTPRKYLVKPYDTQIEVKIVSKPFKTSNSLISAKSDDKQGRINQQKS